MVLAMNSYGGFPGTEATKGLSKGEREKEGKEGGIVALVYLASFIPPVGMSLRKSMGDDLPDSIKNAVSTGLTLRSLPSLVKRSETWC